MGWPRGKGTFVICVLSFFLEIQFGLGDNTLFNYDAFLFRRGTTIFLSQLRRLCFSAHVQLSFLTNLAT